MRRGPYYDRAMTHGKPTTRALVAGCALAAALAAAPAARAQCPPAVPVQGAPLRADGPLFPATNWWNLDVSTAPVDPKSSAFIAFVNNGGTRRLHPDFGGEVAPGSVETYGMPYVVVDGSQPKVAVTFDYADESDGVNAAGAGIPFYPLPAQATTTPHWVEGGAPAAVDQRNDGDRHLIVVDCTNRHLYELYNVWYDAGPQRWYAGSGAFFDLAANGRRPDGWTSADAAGLAILPGLVRYDEAWNPAVTDIGHAFRVTVRATNGYVYPASHRAGGTAGALPMGARLRLKTSVNGQDPALRTTDPNVRKIFRAMQKYGLIVADNGSDLYVTGTFDVRWNNDVLNPAFATLTASDFDVVELGWNPPAAAAALAGLAVAPATVAGGASATGTVTLTAAAPAGGAVVALASAGGAATVPASVTVAAGATVATFAIASSPVTVTTATTISATYGGATKTATLLVAPAPAAASLSVDPASVRARRSAYAVVTLSAPAPVGGTVVALASGNPALVRVPASVAVAAGSTQAGFVVETLPTRKNAATTVSATVGGVTATATLAVTVR